MPDERPSETRTVAEVLGGANVIAVLGASTRRARAAFYVPSYMAAHGFRVISVRPQGSGHLHGGPLLGALSEIGEPVDVLNVFRRPEALEGHLSEILELAPETVWLPTGVVAPPAFAAALAGAGIGLIHDRCMMVEHRIL